MDSEKDEVPQKKRYSDLIEEDKDFNHKNESEKIS